MESVEFLYICSEIHGKDIFILDEVQFNNIENLKIGRLLNNKTSKVFRRLNEKSIVFANIVNLATSHNIPIKFTSLNLEGDVGFSIPIHIPRYRKI